MDIYILSLVVDSTDRIRLEERLCELGLLGSVIAGPLHLFFIFMILVWSGDFFLRGCPLRGRFTDASLNTNLNTVSSATDTPPSRDSSVWTSQVQ